MPKQHNECIVPKHCSIDIHACKCKFIYIILYFTLKGYKHVCMYVCIMSFTSNPKCSQGNLLLYIHQIKHLIFASSQAEIFKLEVV